MRTLASIIVSFLLLSPLSLAAKEMPQTINHPLNAAFNDAVIYLNFQMKQHWNKDPTYLQDGMTYSVEIDQDTAVFKVRRYNEEAPHLEPFMIVKILKEQEGECRILAWEQEFAEDQTLNLSKQLLSWLTPCKGGRCGRRSPE